MYIIYLYAHVYIYIFVYFFSSTHWHRKDTNQNCCIKHKPVGSCRISLIWKKKRRRKLCAESYGLIIPAPTHMQTGVLSSANWYTSPSLCGNAAGQFQTNNWPLFFEIIWMWGWRGFSQLNACLGATMSWVSLIIHLNIQINIKFL